MEEKKPVPELVSRDVAETAQVTMGVTTKLSEAAYYGKGAWDKVPYSVEVHCSVTVQCDQDEQTIRTAQNIAYDLAWEASRESLGRALVGHDHDIRNRLFPHLFKESR